MRARRDKARTTTRKTNARMAKHDRARQTALDVPEKIALTATGPHALLRDVKTLELETDYKAEDWSLRMPYDNFVLTLARDSNGEKVRCSSSTWAPARVLLCAGGSLFTNRALGNADNARLFANIVEHACREDGVVLFDDLRQGLSASYDPARFYRRSAPATRPCSSCSACGSSGCWVPTRLRAPAIVPHDPSEAELVAARGRFDRAHPLRRITRRSRCSIISSRRRACRASYGRRKAPERGD